MADILDDAIAAADGHLKIAQVKLFEAQNALDMLKVIAKKMKEEIPLPVTEEKNLVEAPPEKIREFGFAVVGASFALFLIFALCAYIRRNNLHVTCGKLISTYWHKMGNLGSAYANRVTASPRSTSTRIRPADFTGNRLLQWPTICIMSLTGLISSAYILMVLNPLFGQLLHKFSVFGLTGVWTGRILFISLIVVAGFIRLPVVTELCKIKEMLKNVLQQFWKLIKLQKDNSKYVKNEIKASIENFNSLKERLKEMKSRKIEQNDVENFEAAIETVQAIEKKLKLMKSEKINDEDEKNIQIAIKTATNAVEKIKKIISNHGYPVIRN